MQTQKMKKINIPIRIASVLLCLVLFSLYMTSGMLAKYTTGGRSEGDGRVAKFNVSAVDGGTNEFTFDQKLEQQPDGSYAITITNNSEVAVRYTLKLEFADNIPDYLTIEPKDTNTVITKADKTVTFQGKDLIPGNSSKTESIVFGVDFAKFTEGAELSVDDVELDFNTIVKLTQID